MIEGESSEYPAELVNFVRWFESDGSIMCCSSAEAVAGCFGLCFNLPTPMSKSDASQFISKLGRDVEVYLQPGLERITQVRGCWFIYGNRICIYIDPARPDASQVKTLIHEVMEPLLAISYALHPYIRQKTVHEREKFANAVAANVKMPPKDFMQKTAHSGLDLEGLALHYDETLAGVARHCRDLFMQGRVFYWCRCEIVYAPHRVCRDYMKLVKGIGGPYIRVVDAVHTINVRRSRWGAFPKYNLPSFDHYRVMNPVMHEYIEDNRAVFFPAIVGGASDESVMFDLFDMNNLSALVVPYPKGRTKGFWMIAIEPIDRRLLDMPIERHNPEIRRDVEWLFSWRFHQIKRGIVQWEQQQSLPGINGAARLWDEFAEEPYLWNPS